MNYKKAGLILLTTMSMYFTGCEFIREPVTEIDAGFQIRKSTSLNVVLKTPLSSNINQRGDQFVTELKLPITFEGNPILPKNVQIRGLVKKVTPYQKLGDRAGLVLLFAQVVFSDGRRVPMVARLDTDKGTEAIKIEGKSIQNAKMVTGTTVIGAMVGKQAFKEQGAQKGALIGAFFVN